MSVAGNKTAISVLEEFCKRKLQPPALYTFDSLNTDGKSTAEFVCTVKSFNETKTGKAKSKKEAKHTAALNLINHLRNLESFKFDLVFLKVSPNLLEGKKSSTTNQGKRKAVTKTEPEINYIGKLLEYCVKNKLPPASFDFVEQVSKGQNQIEFTMKCSVNNVEKQGMGANKKQAKQRAAMEVLKELSAGDNDVSPNKRMKIEKSEDANTSPEISEDSGIENGANETNFDLLSGHGTSDESLDYNEDVYGDNDQDDELETEEPDLNGGSDGD